MTGPQDLVFWETLGLSWYRPAHKPRPLGRPRSQTARTPTDPTAQGDPGNRDPAGTEGQQESEAEAEQAKDLMTTLRPSSPGCIQQGLPPGGDREVLTKVRAWSSLGLGPLEPYAHLHRKLFALSGGCEGGITGSYQQGERKREEGGPSSQLTHLSQITRKASDQNSFRTQSLQVCFGKFD